MFLPGRSTDKEQTERRTAFARIEDICRQLISDPNMREECMVSVQEIQCGDPNCAPIDTLVTLQFDSGGQGMLGLPMEAKEVTLPILQEFFPPADIIRAWFDGQDVAWPPEPEPVELRFQVGQRVVCRVSPTEWAPGTIVQQWYREPTWPEGHYAPYKILLSDGRNIFAPQDADPIIRLDPSVANNNNALGQAHGSPGPNLIGQNE